MVENDPFHHSDNRCHRCAVVGSSYNLIKSRYGSLIDSKEIVIRMNTAPVVGYEVDVGSKCTHNIVYPESSWGYQNVSASGKLLLVPFKMLNFDWLISIFTTHSISWGWRKVPTHLALSPKDAAILHPNFVHYVQTEWLQTNGRKPSAGMLALILSLHVCDEVDVFGFGRNQYGNWHHYYDKNENKNVDPFRRTGVHDAETEEAVRMALHKAGVIRFHAGRT
ncbi:CMP-N-acetylneuraminate-beta-galactosamide-alpha-2,3-sialyltransferase 1-like isoform X2 [Corticium candelabrum]|uniref:CMP-N-acetylneuraminate-beta-galactosamide- alpha-2,3-sialyltransferase 1-like isoform X2 n=1 Tax=Corticium candelabrum TaxID=121492 RepID=UPI002E26EE5B|nr:CMP-N-acetylneuraminate-beta-galactosamide-alpha-2,3-sialyltransferase 1-like isoform X2 [Corticium candelabrum]